MASLDDFTLKISELIEKSLDFDKELDEVLDKTASDIISDIKETAPIGNSNEHLKDSFIAKEAPKMEEKIKEAIKNAANKT